MTERRWSTWLIPDHRYRHQYKSIISEYSKKYLTKRFDPHVTLFGRLSIDPKSTFNFFHKLVSGQDHIELGIMGVARGKPPWMSFYIELEKNSVLKRFQNKIDRFFAIHRGYEFTPHLSLAYGYLDINNKIAKKISLDEKIGFSSVALVYTSDNIDEWKLIKKFNLKSE